MLITKEWSPPESIEYGKNILIRCSKGGFEVLIIGAGPMITKTVPADRKEFEIPAPEINNVLRPQISFRSKAEELHVNYELF